ncbi:succinate dehydrogenase, flavoprotein subunit [Sulfurihydrogenibium azorense Az-Fu1]|uniref:Succinate dehydrogenase flavoprotein subunit n=1 Tax=Sulfurihydrogenibium azorense (strain DSM 15241 / OCM 825 / Az-Fu1) TaxID=204536 RepID=C1DXR3_SULAA|nr:succinate dehydrogenase flavoprotein subunit [Sulfurihydrogenibium azorense]ACN98919.1 succinate dehydrogenase, flavoprotein subunit [Sulfurihydrogenibium azorense Az-Fu1]
MLSYDVLIVGAGGAGLMAALEASKAKDVKVAVISKVYPTRSHTGAAQGGINAALANVDPSDNPEVHTFDTVKGSDYLGDQDAIEFMCYEAPKRIYELEHLGVPFSRLPDGRIAQRPFGGAGFPRTCYAADKTGHVILHTLYEQCLKNDVEFLNEWFVFELIIDNNEAKGVIAIDIRSGEVHAIKAKAIIFATGGYARVYWVRNTNAIGSTGDGMAICYRAGIPLKDMEFVQFHPTGLRSTGILVTEGARGEGGYLINNRGERFMERYAPQKMELAPRDLVARSIETEILEGRGWGEGMMAYVHLDLRHLGAEKIKSRLPQIRQLCIDFEGVDPIEEPIPVRPTAHYSMGGIDVRDYKTSMTGVNGVFAVGECACVSVHGANRLGGNSLLDLVVFGKPAGAAAVEYARNKPDDNFNLKSEEERARREIENLLKKESKENINDIRIEMAQTMWDKVGIFREEKPMLEAIEKIKELKERYKNLAPGDSGKIFNTALINYIELGFLLDLAEAIATTAVLRKESRGAHARRDYPNRDDENFLKHSLAYYTPEGPKVEYCEVRITKYQPQERKY